MSLIIDLNVCLIHVKADYLFEMYMVCIYLWSKDVNLIILKYVKVKVSQFASTRLN